jgi:CubicO group peptidase (beta-lactamase class C family)
MIGLSTCRDLSITAEPGTKWTYNSGCTILLSGIITKKTGQSAEEFAKEKLFSKVGITNWEWETGPNGVTNTGWGLSLHPVDMAMFGYLYLKKGVLNGKQTVPENWVNESTSRHTTMYGYQ